MVTSIVNLAMTTVSKDKHPERFRLEEIEAKGYSLTPGAYVGVAPTEDDGVDFHQRMAEIHQELRSLQEESNRLMDTISKNWEEMGL